VPLGRIFDVSVGMAVLASLQIVGNQSMAQSDCDVVKVAQQYIAERYPGFDPTGKTLVVRESGDLSEVTYRLPPWMLGGAPFVTVDRRTCTVIRARAEQ
jgi:hypothetical protein